MSSTNPQVTNSPPLSAQNKPSGGGSGSKNNSSSSSSTQSKPIDPSKIVRECIHKLGQIAIQTRIPNISQLNAANSTINTGGASTDIASSKLSTANKWFNLNTQDVSFLRNQIEQQLKQEGPDSPISIDFILSEGSNKILLERWSFHHVYNTSFPNTLPLTMSSADQAAMYRKMIVLVRNVFATIRLLPTQALFRLTQQLLSENSPKSASLPYNLEFSMRSGNSSSAALPFDQTPNHFPFNSIATNKGKLAVSVYYRPEIDFSFLPTANLPLLIQNSIQTALSSPVQPVASSSMPGDALVIITDYIKPDKKVSGIGLALDEKRRAEANNTGSYNNSNNGRRSSDELRRQSTPVGLLSYQQQQQQHPQLPPQSLPPQRNNAIEPTPPRSFSLISTAQSLLPAGFVSQHTVQPQHHYPHIAEREVDTSDNAGNKANQRGSSRDKDRQLSDHLRTGDSSNSSPSSHNFSNDFTPSTLSRPLSIPQRVSPALPGPNIAPHSYSNSITPNSSHSPEYSSSQRHSPALANTPPSFPHTPPHFLHENYTPQQQNLYDDDSSSASTAGNQPNNQQLHHSQSQPVGFHSRIRATSLPVEIPNALFSPDSAASNSPHSNQSNSGRRSLRKPLPGHYDQSKVSIPVNKSSRTNVMTTSFNNPNAGTPTNLGTIPRESTVPNFNFGRYSSSFNTPSAVPDINLDENSSNNNNNNNNAAQLPANWGRPFSSNSASRAIPIPAKSNNASTAGSQANSASNSMYGRTPPPFANSFGSSGTLLGLNKLVPTGSIGTGSPDNLSWFNPTNPLSNEIAQPQLRVLRNFGSPQIGSNSNKSPEFLPANNPSNLSPASTSPPSPFFTPLPTAAAHNHNPLGGLFDDGSDDADFSTVSMINDHTAILGQFLESIKAVPTLQIAIDESLLRQRQAESQSSLQPQTLAAPLKRSSQAQILNDFDKLMSLPTTQQAQVYTNNNSNHNPSNSSNNDITTSPPVRPIVNSSSRSPLLSTRSPPPILPAS
jgi:hypothetical protein